MKSPTLYSLEKLFELKNQVVIVTGASGQLGCEIVTALISLGANVAAIDMNLKLLEEKSEKFDWDKYKVKLIECDITKIDQVKKSIKLSISHFGDLTNLISNAGVSVFKPFLEREENSIDWVMDVNLKGTIFCIKEFLNQVKKPSKYRSIVNIASHYGIISPDPRIYTDCDRKNSE